MTKGEKHQPKSVKHLFREIEKMGFKVQRSKSGTIRIIPPSHIRGPIYTTHGTDAYPLRREFKKLYNVRLMA